MCYQWYHVKHFEVCLQINDAQDYKTIWRATRYMPRVTIFYQRSFKTLFQSTQAIKLKMKACWVCILTKTQTSNNNGSYEIENLPVSPLLPRLPLFPGGPKKKMVGCNFFFLKLYVEYHLCLDVRALSSCIT